jgi:hypothetical protein
VEPLGRRMTQALGRALNSPILLYLLSAHGIYKTVAIRHVVTSLIVANVIDASSRSVWLLLRCGGRGWLAAVAGRLNAPQRLADCCILFDAPAPPSRRPPPPSELLITDFINSRRRAEPTGATDLRPLLVVRRSKAAGLLSAKLDQSVSGREGLLCAESRHS